MDDKERFPVYHKCIEPTVLKIKGAIHPDDWKYFQVTYVSKKHPLEKFDTILNVRYDWDWFPKWEFHRGHDITWVRIECVDRHAFIRNTKAINDLGLFHVDFDQSWDWKDEIIENEPVHFARPKYTVFISEYKRKECLKLPELCPTQSPWYDVGVFDMIRHFSNGENHICGMYSRTKYGFKCHVKAKSLDNFKDVYRGKCLVMVEKKIPYPSHRLVHLVFEDKK